MQSYVVAQTYKKQQGPPSRVGGGARVADVSSPQDGCLHTPSQLFGTRLSLCLSVVLFSFGPLCSSPSCSDLGTFQLNVPRSRTHLPCVISSPRLPLKVTCLAGLPFAS